MASISITKTTISRVSSLLNQRPSISRVCFCSASNLPQLKPISGDTRDDEYKKYAVGSSMEEMADDIETKQNEEMKDKNSQMNAKIQEAKNRTSNLGHDIKEGTKEGTEGPMNNLGKKAKQRVQDSWDLARETTHKIKQTVVGKSGDDHEK
ncbi:hypothetical protein Leryth_012429 [Lithospermum erythrorhizon]|nr:hypothetical protein Leryth_012429 [Lithospermum erythrorhizon]